MLGLYLHIPFCRRKCPYCDFFSVSAGGTDLDTYVGLLIRHLQWTADHGGQGPVATIYFGGGTPSLLSPGAVAELLSEVDRRLGIEADAEVTLEANPGTVTCQNLEGYRSAGVNRLSLGVQSFDPAALEALGRLHGGQDAHDAVRWARHAGFTSLTLDLMFALPGQTPATLREELAAYLELAPDHLSCYGLTAEPGTPFGRALANGELTLPGDELYAELFLTIDDVLTHHGYHHYEISNYALGGHACRHNLGYWQRRPCLGIGAGAHAYRAEGWGVRTAVPADPELYAQALDSGRDPAGVLEVFDRAGALSETLYLGLRTAAGVSDDDLQQRFGCRLAEAYPEAVNALAGRLVRHDGQWRLTTESWLLFDRLIQAFL